VSTLRLGWTPGDQPVATCCRRRADAVRGRRTEDRHLPAEAAYEPAIAAAKDRAASAPPGGPSPRVPVSAQRGRDRLGGVAAIFGRASSRTSGRSPRHWALPRLDQRSVVSVR
jgi:hypothetical protein